MFSFLQDICCQLKWNSLHLSELPYLEYDEPDSTDEVTLGNMPDLVMQCIFESFNLRDRCIASQVYIINYIIFICIKLPYLYDQESNSRG